jgi:hypothetical protein
MKSFILGFWRGLQSRSAGSDWFGKCLGALGLTIMLSQGLWDEWLSVSRTPLFVEKACLYSLALLAVFCFEGRYLIRHLRRTDRSVWWVIPLMLFLVGLAGPPKWGHLVHVYFVIAFMGLQLPLFTDLCSLKKERN